VIALMTAIPMMPATFTVRVRAGQMLLSRLA